MNYKEFTTEKNLSSSIINDVIFNDILAMKVAGMLTQASEMFVWPSDNLWKLLVKKHGNLQKITEISHFNLWIQILSSLVDTTSHLSYSLTSEKYYHHSKDKIWTQVWACNILYQKPIRISAFTHQFYINCDLILIKYHELSFDPNTMEMFT